MCPRPRGEATRSSSPQLPGDEPGEKNREPADLAGDQQGHPQRQCPAGFLELIHGVTPRAVADVAENGALLTFMWIRERVVWRRGW